MCAWSATTEHVGAGVCACLLRHRPLSGMLHGSGAQVGWLASTAQVKHTLQDLEVNISYRFLEHSSQWVYESAQKHCGDAASHARSIDHFLQMFGAMHENGIWFTSEHFVAHWCDLPVILQLRAILAKAAVSRTSAGRSCSRS
eukprot:4801795-Amphidinium_carterae.1